MDLETARRLSQLTAAFYDTVSGSFSQTRSAPWPGWRHVLEAVESPGACLRALDLACGNLRFERYLDASLGKGLVRGASFAEVRAVDSCDSLAEVPALERVRVRYQHADLATMPPVPQAGAWLATHACDLAVCFAFLHHLPLPEQRAGLLRELVSCVVPGGIVAVSLWQLSKSDRLLAKARETTRSMAPGLGLRGLGPRDYLLGWQGRTDVVRFCHDFPEAEIDELAESVAQEALELARYSADGASNDLNRYLILRRR